MIVSVNANALMIVPVCMAAAALVLAIVSAFGIATLTVMADRHMAMV